MQSVLMTVGVSISHAKQSIKRTSLLSYLFPENRHCLFLGNPLSLRTWCRDLNQSYEDDDSQTSHFSWIFLSLCVPLNPFLSIYLSPSLSISLSRLAIFFTLSFSFCFYLFLCLSLSFCFYLSLSLTLSLSLCLSLSLSVFLSPSLSFSLPL